MSSLINHKQKSIQTIRAGNCECCGIYDNTNVMVKYVDFSNAFYTTAKKNVLKNDSLICLTCRKRLVAYGGEFSISSHKPITMEKFKDFDIFNGNEEYKDYSIKVIFQLSNFVKTFEDAIENLYLIDNEDVPLAYKDSLNVILDFKYLNVSRYRQLISRDRSKNLLTIWDNGETHFNKRLHRILMFAAKIHSCSKFINIWVWANNRIFHMDFFSGFPAEDIQIKPSKIYRV